MEKLIRIGGTTHIICAVLLFFSWFSIGAFMWTEISAQNFSAMVQNPAWIPVNIILLVTTVLLIPGIIGLFLRLPEKAGVLGITAFYVTLLAIIWYAGIQFYETFFWPVIAAESPALFQAVGFSPTNKLLFFQFILSGAVWVTGFILLGVLTFRSNYISKWAIFFYTIGAVLFGVGMAFPVRTVGLFLFCIGMNKYGLTLLKDNSVY
ncbi:hypothetical protein JXQ31_16440 [candidate division KSB1 bacterium]|nr:hypothetical protein [candidate division KSB1 bacterium]